MKKALTFVTISFSGEIYNVLLQARCLSMYGKEAIKKWILVFNEELSDQKAKNAICSIRRELKDPDIEVSVMSREQVVDTELSEVNGGRSQQILKIGISKMIDDEFYVILDAKNHPIRNIRYEDFVEGGEAIVHYQDYGEGNPFYYWFSNAFQSVGLAGSETLFRKYQSTTPYVVNTAVMRGCMDEANYLGETGWMDNLLLNGDAANSTTEFALYGAISELKTNQTIFKEKTYETLFYGWPDNEKDTINTVYKLGNRKTKFFAIHRARYSVLNRKEIETISMFWVYFSIFSDVDKATKFIELNVGGISPDILENVVSIPR